MIPNIEEVNQSSIRHDVQNLSQEFDETMDDCQALIKRYNQLLGVTQQIIREITSLVSYHETCSSYTHSDSTYHDYFQKISKGLAICAVLGEVVENRKTPNDMIGHYLLGAKQEAKAILDHAKTEASSYTTIPNQLEIEQSEKQIASLHQEIDTLQTKLSEQESIELTPDTIEDYVNNTKREADRYSRKRKLILDNQVISAKREIDDYADKREQELKETEIRLELLTKTLQDKFNFQIDGALDRLSDYVQPDK